MLLKLKTADFRTLTRSRTLPGPVASQGELTAIAIALRERVSLPAAQRYRLAGVGISGFIDATELQASLDFENEG